MFEGLFQPMHLLIVLLVVLLVFGPGKLPQVGEALGKTIRDFKRAMQETPERPPGPAGDTRPALTAHDPGVAQNAAGDAPAR